MEIKAAKKENVMNKIRRNFRKCSTTYFIIWLIGICFFTYNLFKINSTIPYEERWYGTLAIEDQRILDLVVIIFIHIIVWIYVVKWRSKEFYADMRRESVIEEELLEDYDFARKLENETIGEKYMISYYNFQPARIINLDRIICMYAQDIRGGRITDSKHAVGLINDSGAMFSISVKDLDTAIDIIKQIKLSHPYILTENPAELDKIYYTNYKELIRIYNQQKK